MTFQSAHYQRCVDPNCPKAYAYRDPFPEVAHWHHIGEGMRDGDIATEWHRSEECDGTASPDR